MKIIITESQENYYYLLRRIHTDEMIYNMEEIIYEGFDYSPVCDYDSFESFLNEILETSAITFILTHIPAQAQVDRYLVDYVFNLMKEKFKRGIKRKYDNDREMEEC
jgi:hypothetical protein